MLLLYLMTNENCKDTYIYSEGYCYAAGDNDMELMGMYLSEYATYKELNN